MRLSQEEKEARIQAENEKKAMIEVQSRLCSARSANELIKDCISHVAVLYIMAAT